LNSNNLHKLKQQTEKGWLNLKELEHFSVLWEPFLISVWLSVLGYIFKLSEDEILKLFSILLWLQKNMERGKWNCRSRDAFCYCA